VKLVAGENVPKEPYVQELACHKKNPDLGTKKVWYADEFFIEQEDALTFAKDEEVPPFPAKSLFRSP
jgi:glutamyl-tRNA synthetase